MEKRVEEKRYASKKGGEKSTNSSNQARFR